MLELHTEGGVWHGCPTMCVTQAADIFGTGLLAGVLFMSAYVALPAAARLDASSHLLFRQQLIHRLAKFMPPLMFLPVAASIAVLAFCRTQVVWPLDAIGCALSLLTIGITVAVNGRLSGRFARWSSDALPQDWEQLVHRWDVAHAIRTVAALGAFVCAILALS